MQSFYYTSNYIEEKINKTSDTFFFFKNKIKELNGPSSLELFYNKNYNFSYSDGNIKIFNIGVFIYKDKINAEALKFFFNEIIKTNIPLDKILREDYIRGQFCLLIVQGNNLKIITDKLGYFPVYIYQKDNCLSFSNSILAISRNEKVTLNNIGIAQYLSENYRHLAYACCNENIFNEITYVDPGTIIEIENNKLSKTKYFDLKKELKISKYKNFSEIVEKSEKILDSNISFLKKFKGKIFSDLTGGVDTRLILAFLSKNKINFKCGMQAITEYSDFSNTGKYSEINVANQIVEHLNIDQVLFSEKDYQNNSSKIDDITFFLSNKQTYNRRTGYFLKLQDLDADLLLSGLSGTELMRLSYYKYFKNNSKLNLKNFLKDYVELVDILKDNYISAEDYYSNLENFYNKNIQDLNYEKDEDLSSYIDYFAFYRTHFCRYLALANSIIPFYTPYGDYSFAKFMYEVTYQNKQKFKIQRYILNKIDNKLSSIDSTRGFPLTVVNIYNFFRFKNLISKNVPQQYFSIKQKIKNFYLKQKISFLFRNRNIYKIFYKNSIKENISKKKNLWGDPNDISVIEAHDNLMKKDLKVFRIVDRDKLSFYIKKDCNFNVIDRVINLNRIIEHSNVEI